MKRFIPGESQIELILYHWPAGCW